MLRQAVKLPRVPFRRSPVIFERTAIQLSPYQKIRHSGKVPKLGKVETLKVIQISNYYDVLYVQKHKNFKYKSLKVSSHQTHEDSKNWRYFVTLYYFLQEYGFEYKIYLESTFEAFREKRGLPYANMLYCDYALNHFARYCVRTKQEHGKTLDSKLTAKIGGQTSFEDVVAEDIAESVRGVTRHLQFRRQRKFELQRQDVFNRVREPLRYKPFNPMEYENDEFGKIQYLMMNWSGCSPYYIASVDSVADFVDMTCPTSSDWMTTFRSVRNNRSFLKKIKEMSARIEDEAGVPTKNLSYTEVDEYVALCEENGKKLMKNRGRRNR